MSEHNPIPSLSTDDEAEVHAMYQAAGMFDDRTLLVLSTVLSAVRAANDGDIEARDRLMREAVEQYEACNRLH
ncbi:MAG TPA: hypothetical protein VHL60_12640 [Oxalicibacterium sp.]|jgi:hypothetical protein|nr:hypothetical protein [Oxalicibacterium sp.]